MFSNNCRSAEFEMIDLHNFSECTSHRKQNRFQLGFRIVYLMAGSCSIIINNKTSILENKSILLLHIGFASKIVLHDDTQGYVITFSPDFVSNIPAIYRLSSHFALHVLQMLRLEGEVREELEYIIEKIINEKSLAQPMSLEIIKQYLKLGIAYISRSIFKPGEEYTQNQPEIVRNFMMLLEKDYGQLKKVIHFAERLHVTPHHLNKTIKRFTGSAPGEHIRNRIIGEAKRLSSSDGFSLKQIAYTLGFDDESHFSKYFKKVAGQNFTRFKKEFRTGVYG